MSDFWPPDHPPDNKHLIWSRFTTRRWGRVLELGPLDARDTINLARWTEKLSSIEGRHENIKRCAIVCDRHQAHNVSLYFGNLETYDLAKLGRFDACWCVGILYHLPKPWELVAGIAQVTDRVFGWSHLADTSFDIREGYRGRVYPEGGLQEPLSGLSPQSWWLCPDDFRRMWTQSGFGNFAWLTDPNIPHPNGGLAAQFMVTR